VLQRGAMCRSVLQCVAVYDPSDLATYSQMVVAVWCSVVQCVAGCCRVLQGVAGCCRVLQCVAMCCSVL